MIPLIFSWHNDVFVVVSITSSAFLYESVTGTVSITFSTKLLDAFPSALIFNVSSNKYTIFVFQTSSAF